MENEKSLLEILDDAMALRGLNEEKLALLSEVPQVYLNALHDSDSKRLPAAPYMRGYLMKIGEALEIDGNLLWQTYKKEYPLKASGAQDKLPHNRFAIKPINKKSLAIAIILVFAIIYFAFRIGDFFEAPILEITNPSSDSVIIKEPVIKLVGKADPNNKLTINKEEVLADNNGHFEKDFVLQPGLNIIEFRVKRFLGKEAAVTKKVVYQELITSTSTNEIIIE